MGLLSNIKNIAGLVFAAAVFANPANAVEQQAPGSTYDLIGNGDRIELREGDFTIVPPSGWEVFTKHPSLTLMMQVPRDPSIKYQRTIQVAAFGGKKFIDEVTAAEYEQVIVRKFSQLSATIKDYRVREHQMVEMTDGKSGILFYTEFLLEDIPMMQAHILVSSEKRHYLMTFTDIADHFEKDEFSQYLNEAWTSMISVELASGAGTGILQKLGLEKFKRFQTLIFFGLGVAGLAVFLAIFGVIRKFKTSNSFGEETGDGGRDAYDTTAPQSLLSSHHPSSHVSDIQERSGVQPMPSNLTGMTGIQSRIQSSHQAPLTGTVPEKSLVSKTIPESRFKTAHEAGEGEMDDDLFDLEEDDKAI